jgi:signal transduction histidine kinase/CheY-like chemotaxis protein
LESDVTAGAHALGRGWEETGGTLGPADFQDHLEMAGLTRGAVFAVGDDGDLHCVAAGDENWVGRKLWRLSMEFAEGWEELIAGAAELPPDEEIQPRLDPTSTLVQVAIPLGNAHVLYADASTAPLLAKRRAAVWAAFARSLLIAMIVGGALLALIWMRLVRPISALAEAAEALASRNSSARISLNGPREVAQLAASLNALATDSQSERNQAQAQAHRWRGLFDAIPVPAFVFSEGGRLLDANQRAQKRLGTDLTGLLHQERSDIIVDGETIRIEPGRTEPVQWVETPMEHEDRSALLAMALDRGDIRKAEAQTRHLAQVLDALNVLVLEVNGEGRVEACNAEAARQLHLSIAQMRGQDLGELFALDGDSGLPPWRRVAQSVRQRGHWTGDMTLERGPSHRQHFLLRVTALPGPPTSAQGYLAVARDVTSLRRAEWDLARASRLEAIGSLAAGVAPELHQQLNGLLTYVSHLRRGSDMHSDVAAGLASVEASAQRVQHLIDTLTEVAQSTALHPEPTDINRLLQEVAADKEFLEAPGLSLELDTVEDLPEVSVDAPLLAHALRAIVRNGVEALNEGGEIALSTMLRSGLGAGGETALPLRGVHVVIEVRDSGPGLDAEAMRRAIDPLFTTRPGHMGLGLTQAVGMIQLMGGRVALASLPGEGTTVAIGLPLEIEVAHDVEPISDLLEEKEAEFAPTDEAPAEESGIGDDGLEIIEPLLTRADTDEAIEELIGTAGSDVAGEEPQEDLEEDVGAEQQELSLSGSKLKVAETEGEDSDLEFEEEGEMETEREPEMRANPPAAPAAVAPEDLPALLVVDDERVVRELVRDIFEDESFEVLMAADGEEAVVTLEEQGDRIFMAVVDLSMTSESDGWEVAEALAEMRPGLPIHIAAGYETEEDDVPDEVQGLISGLVHKPFRAGKLRDLVERELLRFA